MKRSAWRSMLANILAMGLGMTLVLGVLEISLRVLPVNSGLRSVATNATQPVFRFSGNRQFTYSLGWNFALANKGWVNNAGFVNDQDYVRDGPPMLAIVGDSYIEALMVPYGATLQGQLAAKIGDHGRVYSFAASGAPLSQYLAYARHAVQDWGASAIVIVVVGNDFDESLASVKTGPGFHHYVEGLDDKLELRLFDYEPNKWARIAVHSALARYLIFNLKAAEAWTSFKNRTATLGMIRQSKDLSSPDAFIGNTGIDSAPDRLQASQRAVSAFFRDLPEWSGLPPERILFVVDGIRYPSADTPVARQSYFSLMREAFMRQAEAKGYEVIDADLVFFDHARRTNDRFEDPRDGHWNALGHGLIADRIKQTKLFLRFQKGNLP